MPGGAAARRRFRDIARPRTRYTSPTSVESRSLLIAVVVGSPEENVMVDKPLSRLSGFFVASLLLIGLTAPCRADDTQWLPPPAWGHFYLTRLAVKPDVVHMQVRFQASGHAVSSWFGVTISDANRELVDRILSLAKMAVAEQKPVKLLVKTSTPTASWIEVRGIEVFP